MASPFTVISSRDNYIYQATPTTNFGTLAYVLVYAPTTGKARPALEFPVVWGTDVPDGATITLAKLYLYYYLYDHDNPVGRTTYADRLLRLDWHETQSTWNIYKTGSNWTTAGASSDGNDFTSTGRASAVVPAGYGWMEWDITTQVQAAQTGGFNPACILRDSDESGSTLYRYFFYSREEAVETTKRPKIIITYTPPAIQLSVSDGLSFGDSRSESMTASLSVTDGIGAGDSPSGLANMVVSKTDGLSIGDAASIIAALLKQEGIDIGDSKLITMAAELTKSDGLKLSDHAFFVWMLSVIDGLVGGDSTSIEAILSKAEGLLLGDEKSATMQAEVSKTDGVKLSDVDSLIAQLSNSDGMTLADSRILSMLASLLRQDGIELSDEALLINIGRIFKIIALTAKNRNIKAITAKNRDIKTITGGG